LSATAYGGLPLAVPSLTSMNIKAGDRVVAVNARGERGERVALSGIVMGRDFPVVWICRTEEWEAARAADRDPEGVPWPAEDVALLKEEARC
jgi:hypothetical protein